MEVSKVNHRSLIVNCSKNIAELMKVKLYIYYDTRAFTHTITHIFKNNKNTKQTLAKRKVIPQLPENLNLC